VLPWPDWISFRSSGETLSVVAVAVLFAARALVLSRNSRAEQSETSNTRAESCLTNLGAFIRSSSPLGIGSKQFITANDKKASALAREREDSDAKGFL